MSVPTNIGKNKLTTDWFSAQVERLVGKDKLPYMDAILELCAQHEIEPAVAASYISKSIEQHVKQEAIGLHYYKESSTALEGV